MKNDVFINLDCKNPENVKAYEVIKKRKSKTTGNVHLTVIGPLIGQVRDHVDGKNYVQLIDGQVTALLPHDSIIFMQE